MSEYTTGSTVNYPVSQKAAESAEKTHRQLKGSDDTVKQTVQELAAYPFAQRVNDRAPGVLQPVA